MRRASVVLPLLALTCTPSAWTVDASLTLEDIELSRGSSEVVSLTVTADPKLFDVDELEGHDVVAAVVVDGGAEGETVTVELRRGQSDTAYLSEAGDLGGTVELEVVDDLLLSRCLEATDEACRVEVEVWLSTDAVDGATADLTLTAEVRGYGTVPSEDAGFTLDTERRTEEGDTDTDTDTDTDSDTDTDTDSDTDTDTDS